MADISLSKAVRANLNSLTSTASMMAETQNRLSTGNKVNSALDNPSNWFTAKGLNNRAGDLNSLLDGMANGIQTLKAADNGLSAMTKTLESMQSTLRQARQDKSFQTTSVSLDAAAIGTTSVKDLSFSGGAIDGTKSVKLQNNEVVGTGGFAESGTAGRAGTLTLTTANVNDGAAFNINFAATDTAQDVADNINSQISSLSGTSTGFSASVVDGQLKLTDTNGSAVTVAGTNEEYVGLSSADVAAGTGAVDATAVGAGAVGAATAAPFTFTINGENIDIAANATASATANGDELVSQINGSAVAQKYGVVASNAAGTLTLTQADGRNFSVGGASTAGKLNIADTAATTDGVLGAGAVTAAADTFVVKTVDALVAEINANADFSGKLRASNDNGKLRVENQSTQKLDVTGASGGKVTGSSVATSEVAGNTVRAGLADQFNELRDQLDKLADDASFNGINLLRGDNLAITFNETGTSSIDIQTKNGDTINSANLGVSTTLEAKDMDTDANIDGELSKLKTALNSVRSQASSFGSNLSIVQGRQDFTNSMISTLKDGAGNLTLADMNGEAANLLALQTRQSLASNSLSLASQQDQSVLQLIR